MVLHQWSSKFSSKCIVSSTHLSSLRKSERIASSLRLYPSPDERKLCDALVYRQRPNGGMKVVRWQSHSRTLWSPFQASLPVFHVSLGMRLASWKGDSLAEVSRWQWRSTVWRGMPSWFLVTTTWWHHITGSPYGAASITPSASSFSGSLWTCYCHCKGMVARISIVVPSLRCISIQWVVLSYRGVGGKDKCWESWRCEVLKKALLHFGVVLRYTLERHIPGAIRDYRAWRPWAWFFVVCRGCRTARVHRSIPQHYRG